MSVEAHEEQVASCVVCELTVPLLVLPRDV